MKNKFLKKLLKKNKVVAIILNDNNKKEKKKLIEEIIIKADSDAVSYSIRLAKTKKIKITFAGYKKTIKLSSNGYYEDDVLRLDYVRSIDNKIIKIVFKFKTKKSGSLLINYFSKISQKKLDNLLVRTKYNYEDGLWNN